MTVAKHVLDLRVLYQHRKQNALCVKCGAGLQEDDGVVCVDCVEVHAESVANKRARYRRQGRCVDCGDPGTSGRSRCAECRAANAKRSARYRARREAGITPIARAAPRRARATPTYDEVATYRPLDELAQKPRARLLLALAWQDWVSTRELFMLLDVDTSNECHNTEYDAHIHALIRLAKKGAIERRSLNGRTPDWKITDQGRAEVAKIRSGDFVTRAPRKRVA